MSNFLYSVQHASSLHLSASQSSLLQQSRQVLSQHFLLVVVGEYNAAKSSLINALLHLTSPPLLSVGPLPTTTRITIIQHGDSVSTSAADGSSGAVTVTAPHPLLRSLHIVDTPGTNALQRQHEQLTRDFLPLADLLLLATSADRPFSHSERQFLLHAAAFRKRVVVAVTKADLIATAEDRADIERYVSRGVEEVTGEQPTVVSVSTRDQPSVDKLSDCLLQIIRDERAVLKLSSPLQVAERVLREAEEQLQAMRAAVSVKAGMVREVQQANAAYRREMQAECERGWTRVQNVFARLQDRSERWLQQHGSLLSLLEWLRDDMQDKYTKEVWTNVKAEVEAALVSMLDGVAERSSRHVRTVSGLLQETEEALSHSSGGRQHLLLQSLQSGTAEILDASVTPAAATSPAAISASLSSSLLASSALSVSSLSLLLSSSLSLLPFVDVTGIASGLLAVTAAGLMPFRRRQLTEALRVRRQEVEAQLRGRINSEVEREADRVVRGIESGIAAVIREADRGQQAVDSAEAELASLRAAWRQLMTAVDAIRPAAAAAAAADSRQLSTA